MLLRSKDEALQQRAQGTCPLQNHKKNITSVTNLILSRRCRVRGRTAAAARRRHPKGRAGQILPAAELRNRPTQIPTGRAPAQAEAGSGRQQPGRGEQQGRTPKPPECLRLEQNGAGRLPGRARRRQVSLRRPGPAAEGAARPRGGPPEAAARAAREEQCKCMRALCLTLLVLDTYNFERFYWI